LPPSDAAKKPTSVGAAIDAELEALRRQMGWLGAIRWNLLQSDKNLKKGRYASLF
jgi:hypothetical protein